MIRFLLDTNICIFFNKGVKSILDRLDHYGFKQCAISEITYAELLFGVENSASKDKNRRTLEIFMADMAVLPINPALAIFAKEKSRLRKSGEAIDNFDLLIGATALHHDLTLVTNNTRHFQRMEGLWIEDWTK